MTADWQEWPHRLWGDDWIAPMSEVLGINRRTVERWRAGQGAPRMHLQQELRRLAMRSEARSIGAVLRRLAHGESLEDIRREVRAMQVAVSRISESMGKFETIAVLASDWPEKVVDDVA